MGHIANDTQFSTFNLVKTALLKNATILKKITAAGIYQFEPTHKSNEFKGLPYIWVNLPSKEPQKIVLDNNVVDAEFVCPLMLRVKYEERDTFRDLLNATVHILEANEQLFQDQGYYETMVSVTDTDPDLILDEQRMVEAIISITWQGSVPR